MDTAHETHNIHSTLEKLIVPVDGLQHYGRNPRLGDVDAIAESLRVNGQYKPITVRAGTNEVLAGNHTLKAARDVLGWKSIAVTFVDVDDDEAARIVLVDNRTNDLAIYDEDALQELLQSLPQLTGTGYDESFLERMARETQDALGTAPGGTQSNGALAERFGAPPFTVLDARQGPWRARKQAWKDLGIQSELGRDGNLVYDAPTSQFANWYPVKNEAEAAAGRALTDKEIVEQHGDRLLPYGSTGTSIFDPVLTELMYRWYCPPGGHVLDPWAGGSVRGIVASRLGRPYTGVELREEQVAANRLQLAIAGEPAPEWIVGESSEQLQQLPAEAFDMILGCPPYYDLEVYSDDPRDLSNLSHGDFEAAMVENIRHAAGRLRPNSYAVFIVGAVRNKAGHLMDMRSLMVRAAHEAGLWLENDAMLITAIGTARLRAARAFTATRALCRTHQDVLVFLKGDRRAAAARMSGVETQASLEALDAVEVNGDGGDGE